MTSPSLTRRFFARPSSTRRTFVRGLSHRFAQGAAVLAVVALPAAAVLGGAATVMTPNAAEAQARPGSFADLAERLSPAVVNISTAQKVEQAERGERQVPEGTPFEDLFRDFFER
ncbi:MAG: hypothetical protein AAFY66_03640, partial [Pseudomonadota bacterium]